MDQSQRVSGAKRRLTRRQLVQRRPQRVQIRPLIHRPARTPRLLRRHIRQRPHDLGVMGELGTNLGQGHRQREIHQARRAVGRDHDVRWSDVPMQHPPAVHRGHRTGQLHRQPDQLSDSQRLGHLRQAHATRVRHHDRTLVPRRLHQLRDPHHTAQPLQHRHLMPQPPLGVRPQRLLADHRAPRQQQPNHTRAFGLVDDLSQARGSRSGGARRVLIRHVHPATILNGLGLPESVASTASGDSTMSRVPTRSVLPSTRSLPSSTRFGNHGRSGSPASRREDDPWRDTTPE